MYKDNIKLLAIHENELENHVVPVWIHSRDIVMEFSFKKFTILIIRKSKRQMTKGIKLLNQEKSERSEKK